MTKKLTSLLLVLCLLVGILPAISFCSEAATYSGTCGENVNWSLNTGTGVLTISGSGAMTSYHSLGVIELAPWYSYRNGIKTIVIEDGVISIGESAFYNCSDLMSVTIPDSATSIGERAFYSCTNLTSVTIPNSVTWIGKDAFCYCSSLSSVTIPDSVTSIGSSAFRACSILTSVTIPDTVTYIGSSAFLGCDNLTGIWVDAANPNYCSDTNGVLFNKDQTELIQCPGGFSGEYLIPDFVASISDYAFKDCSVLTSVTIPDSVMSVGYETFYGCDSLTSMTMGNSVISIGSYAFCYCSSLSSVTIGDSVMSIGNYTFYDCDGLTSVTMGNSVISIGSYAFYSCDSLTSVTIPDSVTSIDNGAFENCKSLTSVTISDSVTSIGYSAFKGCTSLTSITIPDSVTGIGSYAFSNCTSLTSVMIPDPVTSIGESTFYLCDSLTSISILNPECYIYPDYNTLGYSNRTIIHGHIGSTAQTYAQTYGYAFCVICLEHELAHIETLEPTCTTPGNIEYWHCDACGEYFSNAEATNAIEYEQTLMPALGHDYNSIIAEPTCIEAGYTTYICATCGDSYIADEVDALGHSYEAVVTAPTCVEAGFTTYTCPCGYSYIGDEVAALGHDFADGVCAVCGESDPDYIPENPFVDVKESDYFFTPVLWAVQKGITNGISATEFGPNNNCTRGQIVTFLWRACGSPEPTKTDNPFKDVKSTEYYYKAVLWAVEKGITTGMSANTFEPNATCTRGQVATFLWRSQGKPTPEISNNPFKDVKSGEYYYSAVLWAVENGITNGTGADTFSPDASCTRGQIVTFLYRALN